MFEINIHEKKERINYVDVQEDTILNDLDRDQLNLTGSSLPLDDLTILNCKTLNNQLCVKETFLKGNSSEDCQLVLTFVNTIKACQILTYFNNHYICIFTNSSIYVLKIINSESQFINQPSRLLNINQNNYKDYLFVYCHKLQHYITKDDTFLHVSIIQSYASIMCLVSTNKGNILYIRVMNLLPSLSKDDIKIDIKEITSTSLMKKISGIFMFEGPTKISGYIGLEVLKLPSSVNDGNIIKDDGLNLVFALNHDLCLLIWFLKDNKVVDHKQIDVCELFDYTIDVNTFLISKIQLKSFNYTYLIINFPTTNTTNVLLILKMLSQGCDYSKNKLPQDIFDSFTCEYPSHVELIDLNIVDDCIWLSGINTTNGDSLTMNKLLNNGCLGWQMIEMEESIVQLPTSSQLKSLEWEEHRILDLIFNLYTFSKTDIVRSINILLGAFPLSKNVFRQESLIKCSKQQLRNLFEEELASSSPSINSKELLTTLYSYTLNYKKESTRPLALAKSCTSSVSNDPIFILDASMQGSMVCTLEPLSNENDGLYIKKVDTFVDMLVAEKDGSEMSTKLADFLSNGAYMDYLLPNKPREDQLDPRNIATEMAEYVLQRKTYEGAKKCLKECFPTHEALSKTLQILMEFIAQKRPVDSENLVNTMATEEIENTSVPALDFVCKAFNVHLTALSGQTTRYLFFTEVVFKLFQNFDLYQESSKTEHKEPSVTRERRREVEHVVVELSNLALYINSMLLLSGRTFILLPDHVSVMRSVKEQLNKIDVNMSFPSTSLFETIFKLISSDMSEISICEMFLRFGLENFSLPSTLESVNESEEADIGAPARRCGRNLICYMDLLRTIFWPKSIHPHHGYLSAERTDWGTLNLTIPLHDPKSVQEYAHIIYHLILFMLRTAQFSVLIYYMEYFQALNFIPRATNDFIRAICYLNMYYYGNSVCEFSKEFMREKYLKLFKVAAYGVPAFPTMTTRDHPSLTNFGTVLVRCVFEKIDCFLKAIKLLDHFGDQEGILVMTDFALGVADRSVWERHVLENTKDNSNKVKALNVLTQEVCNLCSTLWLLKFQAALQTGHYDIAYEAIFKNPQANRRIDCLRKYLNHLYEKEDFLTIVLQPYNELYVEASAVLLNKMRSLDSSEDALYQKSCHLLFAFYTLHDKTFQGVKIMLDMALEYEKRLPHLFDSNNASVNEITYEETINSLQIIARALLVALSAMKLDKKSWVAFKNAKISEENSDFDMENDEERSNIPKFDLKNDVKIYKSADVEKNYLMVTSILKLEQFKPYTLDSLCKPLSVANIVERLIFYGFFDDAFRLAQFDTTNAQPDLVGSIFSRLASVCCALDTYGPARTKKLFDDNMTWQWLENKSALYNPYASADELYQNSSLPARDFSMAEKAWLVTQRYLHIYDQKPAQNGLRCVTEEMLSLGQTLPLWITKHYTETKRGQCELLRLLLFYQRYDEAVVIACEMIEFAKSQIENSLKGKRDKIIPDSWLPLSSINFLIDVLDKLQDNPKLYQCRQQLTDNFESFLTQRQLYCKGIKSRS